MRTSRAQSTHDEIIEELRVALDNLAAARGVRIKTRKDIVQLMSEPGAPQDVLAVVNSWGDTLSDEEVLDLLRSFNESGTIWKKIYASLDR